MTTKKSQVDILYEALKRGERLTVVKALQKYGCYALSQRVSEINRRIEREWMDDGKSAWPIESRTIKTENGARVSEYYLPRR